MWKLMADGFPPNLRSYVHRCDACSGRMKHRPVPDGTRTAAAPSLVDSTTPLGQRWFMDFKDFVVPDLDGNTGFALFVEYHTLYVVITLIEEHHEFWDHAQDLVDTMRLDHDFEIQVLNGDSDPVWRNSNRYAKSVDTESAKAFKTKNKLDIKVSPPDTHATNWTSECLPLTLTPSTWPRAAWASSWAWSTSSCRSESFLQK